MILTILLLTLFAIIGVLGYGAYVFDGRLRDSERWRNYYEREVERQRDKIASLQSARSNEEGGGG